VGGQRSSAVAMEKNGNCCVRTWCRCSTTKELTLPGQRLLTATKPYGHAESGEYVLSVALASAVVVGGMSDKGNGGNGEMSEE